ncbi:MAG TPA: hypothetical protein VMV62_01975 [Candidatus Paceibacterota bacterium]|nr:hypothetical protein [Candidatus Paceibacterota bacterium]
METFSENLASEISKQFGHVAPFEPCTYCRSGGEVVVLTEDCSYCAEKVNDFLEIFWQNHRPWYALWKKCVGFSVYAPFSFSEDEVLVVDILGAIEERFPKSLGKHRNRLYQAAESLKVRIP